MSNSAQSQKKRSSDGPSFGNVELSPFYEIAGRNWNHGAKPSTQDQVTTEPPAKKQKKGSAKGKNIKQKKSVKNSGSVVSEVYAELVQGVGTLNALAASSALFNKLLTLDHLKYLDNFLWENFSEDASDHHVVSIALMVVTISKDGKQPWAFLKNKPEQFSGFFHRVLSVLSTPSTELWVRTQLVHFLTIATQSLDLPVIRKELAPIVSILIWNRLSSESLRNELLAKTPSLQKLWKHHQKRLTNAQKDGKNQNSYAQIVVASEWLFSSLMGLLDILYSYQSAGSNKQKRPVTSTEEFLYTARYLELLIAFVSQLPTRRFANTLLFDVHLIPAIKQSPFYKAVSSDNDDIRTHVFSELVNLLDYYMRFPIDDFSGEQLSEDAEEARVTEQYAKLRSTVYAQFPEQDQTGFLAYSNFAALGKRDVLADHLQNITLESLESLCTELRFRTEYPIESVPPPGHEREFLLECVLERYERKPTIQQLGMSLETLPTEKSLFSSTLQLTEDDGSENSNTLPLPIHQMALQYLSTTDFLMRAFQLERHESFFEIKQDVESTAKRLKPQTVIVNSATSQEQKLKWNGTSKMAARLTSPVAVLEVTPPKIGSYDVVQEENPSKPTGSFFQASSTVVKSAPGRVRAEVVFELEGYAASGSVLSEWDSLKPGDVVFLVQLQTPSNNSLSEQAGVKHLRSAEVIQVMDERNQPLYKRQFNDDDNLDEFDVYDSEDDGDGDKKKRRVHKKRRKLHVYLDSLQYAKDTSTGAINLYKSLNAVFRRRARENNFHRILENIKGLTLEGNGVSEKAIPDWLTEVFLGYGDVNGASYEAMHANEETRGWFEDEIDYRDTFLDKQHLAESFPGATVTIESEEGAVSNDLSPPYLLPGYIPNYTDETNSVPAVEAISAPEPTVYGMTPPKRNQIRFTPRQVEALVRSVLPGLTVIVGPPGTGKTDVAAQAIANIYHNYPNERTLVVAHSNNALNHIFEKIVELDVEDRHVVRLGGGEEQIDDRVRKRRSNTSSNNAAKEQQGEEEKEAFESFSKYGRVERLQQVREQALGAVVRLAASLGVENAAGYGDGCDTGIAFFELEVEPRWKQYTEAVLGGSEEASVGKDKVLRAVEEFPFAEYFSESGDDGEEGRARVFWPLYGGVAGGGVPAGGVGGASSGYGGQTILAGSLSLKKQFRAWLATLAAAPDEKETTQPDNDATKTQPATTTTSAATAGRATDLAEKIYTRELVKRVFGVLEELRAFEVVRGTRARAEQVAGQSARVVAMTATFAAMNRAALASGGFQCGSIIVEEAAQMTEIETVLLLALAGSSHIKRVVLIGDDKQNAPIVQNNGLRQYGHLDQSLFGRLVRLRAPTVVLNAQGRARPELVALYGWQYSAEKEEEGDGVRQAQNQLVHLPRVLAATELKRPNAGLLHLWQLVDVEGATESEPSKHFFQNVAEAEYVVAVYQYLRLLGYPRASITILSAYFGQKKLIEEIVEKRCCNRAKKKDSILEEMFGAPQIKTIDEYQGEQNDIVLVSLVRTKRAGYLRDRRRLTVAVSRARHGLYLFGSAELLNTLGEEEELVARLMSTNPADKLMVVTGEMYNGQAQANGKRVGIAIEGVEHMGEYVYEMANTRRRYLADKKASGGVSDIRQ